MVASHGQALLKSGDHIGMVSGALRDPASMLRHPGVLSLHDLAQPLSELCTGTLHFVADQAGPHKIIAEYRDQLAPGSYLAITHGTLADDPAREGQAAERVYRPASSQLHLRPLPDVLRFFEGFELVEPGSPGSRNGGPSRGPNPPGGSTPCAAASAASPSRRTRGGCGLR